MTAVGGGVHFGVNYAVGEAVKADAVEKATGWADYFIQAMPRLEDVLTIGKLDSDQAQIVNQAESIGNVFRFKLFDEKGGTVIVSDETSYVTEAASDREHSRTAAAVLASGISDISMKDGTGKADRPPLYVEAYIPITAPDGSRRGVVEVYVDQTSTAALFRATFGTMALALALGAALAFGLPSLGFLLRSWQAREAKRRVEFLAHHDPMTSLMNRASFSERFEAELGAADAAEGLALVFIDVDDFKGINDSFGHQAGDEFLKHSARAMTALAGPRDIVARLGGDEFTMVLPATGREQAVARVEEILQAIRVPLPVGG